MACGKVEKSPGNPGGDDDGGGGDAGIDANLTPVTVTVLTTLGDGAPDPNAVVLFQDPDGNVVSDGAVDVSGHAHAMLPRGGTVSAIRYLTDSPTALVATISTTTGVEPGDDLTFGVKAFATITNQGGQTTMTASFFNASNATKYSFFTPCGVSRPAGTPVTLTFRDSCHGGTFDVLGVTADDTTGALEYIKVSGVNYVNGGTFSFATAFTAMPSFAVNATNVPAAVSSMNVIRASLNANLPVGSTSAQFAGDPPAGNATINVPFADGFGTRSELTLLMGRPDADVPEQIQAHTATLGSSATLDAGKLLPWITNLAQTATGMTWTNVAPGDAPDGMLMAWSGNWNDGTRPVTVTWNLTQPVATTTASATLPRLPAAYAKIDPGQQSVVVAPGGVTLYMADYDNLAGYGQLRLMPETLLTTSIGNMGAFVGTPFQRRMIVASH